MFFFFVFFIALGQRAYVFQPFFCGAGVWKPRCVSGAANPPAASPLGHAKEAKAQGNARPGRSISEEQHPMQLICE
eukprot:gene11950-8225_t